MKNSFTNTRFSVKHYASLLSLFFVAGSAAAQPSYLDPSLPAEQRVELLLGQMTLDEKIGQMCQYVGEASDQAPTNQDEQVQYVLAIGERAELVKSGEVGSFLKVPSFKEANYLQALAEQSRLKIPLLIATDALHGHGMYQGATTLYPTQIGVASSFDTEVARDIARFTAREMRASGFHWAFSPNIEIVRDPRWGRTGETFGEDPHLVAMMGKAMVEGYQGNNFSDSDNVIANAKHFVAGGIAINGLNGAAADVSERTLNEIFFPPFIAAIEAGVYTLMPAHNEVNGIPAHAHEEYLTELIRGKWGFTGFIVSDWMDIERLHSVHKVAPSEKAAAKLAVLAGVDMHMHGPGFFEHVKQQVETGAIPIERIDEAVRKILFAKFQLGLFEQRHVDETEVRATLLKEEHVRLAVDAARKSIVLLKNKGDILPLSKEIGSIFITGPSADSQALLGDWARVQPDDNITTVREGIAGLVASGAKVDHLRVGFEPTYAQALLTEAQERAAAADVTVIALGENSLRFDEQKTSGENLDRASLELPGDQLALLKAVHAAGKPVVVVLINGAPIASPWMAENAHAIVEAWEPGMRGGQAIAEVLFGDYNPAGRLPITVPYSAGHIQSFYNRKPSAFHRGRFYQSQQEPLFEFGHGLSYTHFTYSDLKLPKASPLNEDVKVTFTIENSGKVAGDEVVLIYLNDKISSVTTPVRKLAAFRRVTLQPNEKRKLTFTLPMEHFMLYDKDMKQIVEPGEFEVFIGNDGLTGVVTKH